MDQSIVITGCGWINPCVAGPWRNRRTSKPPASKHHTISDDVLNGGPTLPEDLAGELEVRLAARAVQFACEDAALPLESLAGDRTGLIVGCALAGQGGMIAFANEVREQSARFVSPIHFPQTVGNYPAGAIGRAFHIRGVNSTIACGAAAGLEAVAEGARQIAGGAADVVIAGGLEVFTEPLARALGIHHPVLADAACFFVLESQHRAQQRGAIPLAAWSGLRRVTAGARLDMTEGAFVTSAGCAVPGSLDVAQMGWSAAASGAAALALAFDARHSPAFAVAAGAGDWWALAQIDRPGG